MFSIGDVIVYESTGVCRVVDISPRAVAGSGKDVMHYTLKPLYQNGFIYIPVDSDKVFMRDVITRERAEQLIDMIPGIKAEICSSGNRQQLIEHYQSAFSSHSCVDLIELIKSIYSKQAYAAEHHRRLGQLDARYMKRAEELLYGEFSVALGIPKSEVVGYIKKRIGEAK